ncbi:hypothetical protein Q8A67_005595 [Cirrhinus molitorella]|uniref:Uncharacterized protein n=1 Tax=Cirrhinus molitorella TaxID=172907 RepID=A0AA88TVJ0_9TELE|nr:hypothetical protein Q8A67_005595 [Cirrhinus molitorella]
MCGNESRVSRAEPKLRQRAKVTRGPTNQRAPQNSSPPITARRARGRRGNTFAFIESKITPSAPKRTITGNTTLHQVVKQIALKQLLSVSTLKAPEEANEEKAARVACVTLKRTPFSCSFEALGSEPQSEL